MEKIFKYAAKYVGVELIVAIALEAIQDAVKNPTNKRKLRNVLLQVARTILTAYEGDAAFEALKK